MSSTAPKSPAVHNLDSTPASPPLAAASATNFVLGESVEMPSSTPQCRGYDFNQGVDVAKIMDAMMTTGFQATNMARAVEEIRRMRRWRLSDTEWKEVRNRLGRARVAGEGRVRVACHATNAPKPKQCT